MTRPEDKNMDELVALCKRRGFVYPASEIYGGLRGFWDYGPLGTALKNNIRDWWWHCMVDCPPIGPDGDPVSIVGLDSAIIQNPKTWQHSGHVGGFNDPMMDDTETKQRFRADHLVVLIDVKEFGSLLSSTDFDALSIGKGDVFPKALGSVVAGDAKEAMGQYLLNPKLIPLTNGKKVTRISVEHELSEEHVRHLSV